MTDPSKTSIPEISEALPAATSSPESPDGTWPLHWPGGQMELPSGLDPALANPSAKPVSAKDSTTSATSGPSGES